MKASPEYLKDTVSNMNFFLLQFWASPFSSFPVMMKGLLRESLLPLAASHTE